MILTKIKTSNLNYKVLFYKGIISIIKGFSLIDTKKLIELSSYFSIIHHIKGRIRLRVSSKIKEMNKNNISLSDIESLSQKVKGIKRIKVNKIVGSITIDYDSTIFSDSLWVDLIEQKNLEHITSMINELSKDLN